PADDIRDAGVAFPPALVRTGEGSGGIRLRSEDRVATRDGAYSHRIARVCHVPDLVRGIGVGSQHIDLVVVDRQGAAVTDANHLGTAVYAVRYRQMVQIFRVARVGHIHNGCPIQLIVAGQRVERG